MLLLSKITYSTFIQSVFIKSVFFIMLLWKIYKKKNDWFLNMSDKYKNNFNINKLLKKITYNLIRKMKYYNKPETFYYGTIYKYLY